MKRSGFKRPERPERSAYVFGPKGGNLESSTLHEAMPTRAAAEALLHPVPKNPRVTDEKYLAFLRTEACVGCGKPGPNHAHHRHGEPGTLKGMNVKSSDYDAVPLCETIGTREGCHDRWHREQRFEGKTKQETIEMMERARAELREEYRARTEGIF